MIARPVSLPPAWTIRRAEWPPSRPSASSPVVRRCRSATPALAAARRRPPAPPRSAPPTAAGGTARVRRSGCPRRGARASRRAPATPPARPAPSSSSSRRAACARSRTVRAPASAARIATNSPGGPAADDGDVELGRCFASGSAPSAALRYPRVALYVAHPSSHLARHRPASRERGPAARRSRRRWPARDWLGLERVEAPAGRRASSSSASTRAGHIDAIESFGARGRRHDRPRHGGQRGLLRGGAARGRRRRCSGRAPAGRRGARRVLRAAPAGPPRRARPGDGLLPVQQRRRGRRARDRRVRRRAGPGPRLGRPPRQRHGGDLRATRTRCSTRASTSRRSIPAPAPAAYTGPGRGRGLHGQPAGAAGRGRRRVPRPGPARRRPARARVRARAAGRSRPATTPTAPTRWPPAWSTRPRLRRHGGHASATSAASWTRRSWSASRAATTRAPWPRRWSRRSRLSTATERAQVRVARDRPPRGGRAAVSAWPALAAA